MGDDLLAAVTDHDDQALRFELAGRGQHVTEHAAAAQLVQDLGGAGLHPGALTGGEDDYSSRAHLRRLLGVADGTVGLRRRRQMADDLREHQ
ncbi:hypothetical protein GCM10009780_18600 [Actinomadura alba]